MGYMGEVQCSIIAFQLGVGIKILWQKKLCKIKTKWNLELITSKDGFIKSSSHLLRDNKIAMS